MLTHTCAHLPARPPVAQAENATQKQVDLIKINDNTKRNLEQEIQGYKMEAQKQSKLIYQLEKEREKYAVEASEARELAALGEKVRLAARAQLTGVRHPENPGIDGVSIVQLHRPFAGVGAVTRNTCIVAPGRSDRSPTGTGTCARMAVLHARGQMRAGDSMIHESLIGSRFEGRILAETTVGGRPAIVPSIAGRAWITGMFSYFIDPDDPWPEGFQVADMMGVTGSMTQ